MVKDGSDVFFVGATAQARLCSLILARRGYRVAAIFDRNTSVVNPFTCGIFHNPSDFDLAALTCDAFLACIGGTEGEARRDYSERLVRLGLAPCSAVHDTAFIGETVDLGRGAQVMPHAVINEFSKVGDWCIFNTNCTVDHDCVVGDGVHIMGGASVAGEVKIGKFASIGTNATVLPRITIGVGAIIGAGAVVTKDVAEGEVVVGVPARPV